MSYFKGKSSQKDQILRMPNSNQDLPRAIYTTALDLPFKLNVQENYFEPVIFFSRQKSKNMMRAKLNDHSSDTGGS